MDSLSSSSQSLIKVTATRLNSFWQNLPFLIQNKWQMLTLKNKVSAWGSPHYWIYISICGFISQQQKYYEESNFPSVWATTYLLGITLPTSPQLIFVTVMVSHVTLAVSLTNRHSKHISFLLSAILIEGFCSLLIHCLNRYKHHLSRIEELPQQQQKSHLNSFWEE